jgi:hypothetical protein
VLLALPVAAVIMVLVRMCARICIRILICTLETIRTCKIESPCGSGEPPLPQGPLNIATADLLLLFPSDCAACVAGIDFANFTRGPGSVRPFSQHETDSVAPRCASA